MSKRFCDGCGVRLQYKGSFMDYMGEMMGGDTKEQDWKEFKDGTFCKDCAKKRK